MTARYLLFPGSVRSIIDGQVHHVTAPALARLYGVPLSDCVALPCRPGDSALRDTLLARAARGELVALHPRADGAYSVPANAPA